MSIDVDTVIRGGRVIDPGNDVDDVLDVAVKDGLIFTIGKHLDVNAKENYDATGCIVTPGLIDAHVHCYTYATPLGVDPDVTCLSRGVTTVIDAGSAGASTFLGLKKFIIERSKTRVKALLHIALHGLAAAGCAGGAAGGESDTVAILDTESCRKCIEAYRADIVGVKVRLQSSVCAKGKTEEEAYRRALFVSEQCKVPLMVHHIDSSIPTQRTTDTEYGCPGNLRPGDVYTHSYHGYNQSIIDVNTQRVHDDVKDARSRGVIFDVGHGFGSFSWTCAELAVKDGLFPDTLGSDLHIENVKGPAYDLVTVMSRFLYLGMPLYDVIKAVTSTPAKVYGIDDVTGSLKIGIEADITVLKIENTEESLEDPLGQTRTLTKRFVPMAVWRKGIRYPIQDLPWIGAHGHLADKYQGNRKRAVIYDGIMSKEHH